MLDAHTHVLPGLDDGVGTEDEAVQVLRGLAGLGFTHVAATTHYLPGRYTAPTAALDAAIASLRSRLTREEVAVSLVRGRECMFDFELTTAPERDAFPFEWNGRRFQLLELPAGPLAGLQAYVSALARSGVTPILAHVERYAPVLGDPARVREYADLGFRIQVDLRSFHPSAPSRTRRTVRRLLEEERIDLLASDVHAVTQLGAVGEAMDFVRKECGDDRFRRLFTLE